MTNQQKRRIVYAAVLATAVLWNLAIVAAPWSWSQGHSTLASGLYLMFSPLCHQRADRSFYLFGHHLAVCNRCTGIYEGALMGLLLLPLLSLASKSRAKGLLRTGVPHRAILFLALLLMAADVAGELLGIRPSTPMSRFLTGAFCGIVAPFYLLPAIFEIFVKAPEDSTPATLRNAPEIGEI